MRKSIFYKLSIFIFLGFLMYSCTPQRMAAGNYNTYETECIGVEGDGTQTLLSWGQGRNRMDAVEQAKKNAVRDVIFKGISYGKGECNSKPLITEVNAEEKYEDYFFSFFIDKGPYLEFVSFRDERIDDKIIRNRQGGDRDVTNSVVVLVNRHALKQKLRKDEILKF